MKANQLINSKSIYLQQHAHNPVEWHIWSKDALNKSKLENKPILVSIGYSACHWCHVMEKESFEDLEVAKLMNSHFICIKIDREERPDLDNIYMEAVQVMGLQGGWPLNVFLLPNQKPFYGGTYFSKDQWIKVLAGVARAFSQEYEELVKSADAYKQSIDRSVIDKYGLKNGNTAFLPENVRKMARQLIEGIDPVWGGMKRVPKFPMPVIWSFLLDMAILDDQKELGEQVCFTLEKMGMGGIYDHLGGGFCRYSVDGKWFVPHFEKMLYDNGQLLSLYSKAYQYSSNAIFKEKITETISWLLNEMCSPEMGFYASMDADSEGEEGKFYTWTYLELEERLGGDLDWFCQLYGIKKQGNWEPNVNLLFQTLPYKEVAENFGFTLDALQSKLTEVKQRLLTKRGLRIRPGLDDKIISGWNGWVIDGLCHAYLAIGDEEIRITALASGNFIWNHMVIENVLYRNYKDNEAYTPAFLEDYGAVIQCFISLYKISFDPLWVNRAELLTQKVMESFYDEEDGMFYFNDPKTEKLIAKKKEIFDNVIPSSNSVMARNLHQLGLYLYKDTYLAQAKSMLQLVSEMLMKEPDFLANWANFYLEQTVPTAEMVIVGKEASMHGLTLQKTYQPNTIVAAATETDKKLPILGGKVGEKSTFYVCFDKTCKQPVDTCEAAVQLLPKLPKTKQ
ncbi:thioredoxin domain-containing protein [Cyclobacterium sp. 1_MG-2023]|uniref:thioredoxin domain-containing protein n=1 Tax=Cyclobacterium sp. 1_MG-2023 TaxID=3062681 RepID=UPI0026E1C583|nr:thioredoxin domain-containing protein [Cyclobacterium sp. 1_MG-2023]MDO6436146.1 thioredoxin domain-containing protein [Cyclobacterium sp. 1_MG-2023]